MTSTNVRFKRKKVLTRPVLKLREDNPVYIKIQGPMQIGKEMKPGADGKKKEPATVADVINLESGEEAQIICGAVIKSVLNESYPDNKYVGLCFAFTKQARQPGKEYNPVHIEEIEAPEPVAQEAVAQIAADAAGESTQSPTTPPGNRRR